MLWKIFIALGLIGIPVMLWSLPIGSGWLIGQFIMAFLVIIRKAFYKQLIDKSNFSTKKYIAYVLFTISLISAPLLFSFFVRGWIEPLAIFGAYFIARIITYVFNLLVHEEKEKKGASN